MTNKIKFNERYEKLSGIDNHSMVVLLQVIEIDKRQLSESFIEYDTMYLDDDLMCKNYEIKNSKLLLLIFMAGNGMAFTTLRKYTPTKLDYYRKLENEEMELVVLSEDGEQ